MAKITKYVQKHYPSRLDIGYDVRGHFKRVQLAEMLHAEHMAFFAYISKKGGWCSNEDPPFKYRLSQFPDVQGYAVVVGIAMAVVMNPGLLVGYQL